MACLCPIQLPSLSWGFSGKPTLPSLLFPFQNANPSLSFSISCKNRVLSSQFRSSQAVLNTSSVSNTTEIREEAATLREICEGHVPEDILNRMEEIGYVVPTDVQRQALPILFDGSDCILNAQTGSGKTLAYLLLIFSVIYPKGPAVQALIVVPTRELGLQVTKVARMLAGKLYNVMALLDEGMKRGHKAAPAQIVVATIRSLCVKKRASMLGRMQVLVIDEVDFMFNSSEEVSSLRKLLTSYSLSNNRQTVFASASIPQHRRFLYDCIQEKWTKSDVVHVHVNRIEPMPSRVHHRFVKCSRDKRHETLLSLLVCDAPESGIIFVGEQSEKSKRAGNAPPTTVVIDFLKTNYGGGCDIFLMEEDMNFHSRAASLSVSIVWKFLPWFSVLIP